MSKNSGECVRVIVRCRPLNSTETAAGHKRAVEVDKQACCVNIIGADLGDGTTESKSFPFDAVFDWNSNQREVYDHTARGIVDSVLEGYNGTIFAYGQTGAGKTHTMEGDLDSPDTYGIIPNAFRHIFDSISTREGIQWLVRVAYLEIYNEQLRDLLSGKGPLQLREGQDGVYVQGLDWFVVKSPADLDKLLADGKAHRKVAATKMNSESSRSHSIFTVIIERSEIGQDGKAAMRAGKLNLVDLAGSERQSKTGATGIQLKEGANINLSLSALGNVIAALTDPRATHIPYRDSKLTRLLQDSLGGNAKTVMVANIGPASYNVDETTSTLRYATRAKKITNKPKINEDPKDALLRQFQEEIARLKAALAAAGETAQKVELPSQDSPGIPKESAQSATVSDGGQSKVTVDTEAVVKEVEERVAAERAQLLSERAKSDEERARIAAELSERERMMEEKRRETEELRARLQAMEQQLVSGDDVLDRARLQELELKKAQAELEERQQLERRLKEELESQQAVALEEEKKYSSLQEEVVSLRKKLKKVFAKFREAQAEARDVSTEAAHVREDMTAAVRALQKQLKLRDLIIESFIPPEERAKIEQRASWDEHVEEWNIQSLQLAGAHYQRPALTGAAQQPAHDVSHQPLPSLPSSITGLEFEAPDGSTGELNGAAHSNTVLLHNGTTTLFVPYSRHKSGRASARPKIAGSHQRKPETQPEFPKSRGVLLTDERKSPGSAVIEDIHDRSPVMFDQKPPVQATYPSARGLLSARAGVDQPPVAISNVIAPAGQGQKPSVKEEQYPRSRGTISAKAQDHVPAPLESNSPPLPAQQHQVQRDDASYPRSRGVLSSRASDGPSPTPLQTTSIASHPAHSEDTVVPRTRGLLTLTGRARDDPSPPATTAHHHQLQRDEAPIPKTRGLLSQQRQREDLSPPIVSSSTQPQAPTRPAEEPHYPKSRGLMNGRASRDSARDASPSPQSITPVSSLPPHPAGDTNPQFPKARGLHAGKRRDDDSPPPVIPAVPHQPTQPRVDDFPKARGLMSSRGRRV